MADISKETVDATPNVSEVETVDAATEAEAVAAIDAPVSQGEPILQVRNLVKHFPLTKGILFNRRVGEVRAVDGVSFDVLRGETLGLVGESGCGKSVTSLAIMGLLAKRGVEVAGEVLFDGSDLLTMPRDDLRDLRGRDIAMVFQDPMSSLNPVVPVGTQVTEVLRRHAGLDRNQARDEAEQLTTRRSGSASGPSCCTPAACPACSATPRRRRLVGRTARLTAPERRAQSVPLSMAARSSAWSVSLT